jgi:hypothetical protein
MSSSVNEEEVIGLPDKQHAHDLLDKLDPSQLAAVVHLLEVITDPLARSLANAPVDGEEITPAMATELDRARASIERGEGVPHEEVLSEAYR